MFFIDGVENRRLIVEVISALLVIHLVAVEMVAVFAVILRDRQIGYLARVEARSCGLLGGSFLAHCAGGRRLAHPLCYNLGHCACLLAC